MAQSCLPFNAGDQTCPGEEKREVRGTGEEKERELGARMGGREER